MSADVTQLLNAIEEGDPHVAEKLPAKGAGLLTIFPGNGSKDKTARPFGLARGQFVVPADFKMPLPDEVLREFEGG